MSNINTSTPITKFQDLKVDETYLVNHIKPIKSKFGESYILKVTRNGEDSSIEVFSTKSINDYIKVKKIVKHPKQFDFVVRRITKGNYVGKLYAEIDGFNSFNSEENAGFIELK